LPYSALPYLPGLLTARLPAHRPPILVPVSASSHYPSAPPFSPLPVPVPHHPHLPLFLTLPRPSSPFPSPPQRRDPRPPLLPRSFPPVFPFLSLPAVYLSLPPRSSVPLPLVPPPFHPTLPHLPPTPRRPSSLLFLSAPFHSIARDLPSPLRRHCLRVPQFPTSFTPPFLPRPLIHPSTSCVPPSSPVPPTLRPLLPLPRSPLFLFTIPPLSRNVVPFPFSSPSFYHHILPLLSFIPHMPLSSRPVPLVAPPVPNSVPPAFPHPPPFPSCSVLRLIPLASTLYHPLAPP
jgi:hypothetical protein